MSAMDPFSQRVAICNAVGYWFGHDDDNPEEYWHVPPGFPNRPDWVNCKNDMRLALATRWDDVTFRAKYAELLHAACGYVPCGSLFATAAQEAECFLRAIGKYEGNT